jgi:S-adenosylmethionine:tRNA ribosyltransferase-isomerase
MRTSDFDFYLPDELIAQFPAQQRSASRLLYLNGDSGELRDEQFLHLPNFFQAGDVLVFNNTKVIKARLFGHKLSGGQVEALIERVLDTHTALAHIRASRSPKVGSRIRFADSFEAEVLAREDDLFLIKIHHDQSLLDLLDEFGALPLPPYISHSADAVDDERYQTVYAQNPGAVAAPTAGLHFDEAMLARLEQMGCHLAYVTLHVGAGTFQPVRTELISEHKMHSEWYSIPDATANLIADAQAKSHRINAVGTTVMRTLESSAQAHGSVKAGEAETDIFITPGYQFRVVNRMVTNFHLPKSTLLMLVSAFAGIENIKRAYAHAVEQRYRFFSYGDAMLLERKNDNA